MEHELRTHAGVECCTKGEQEDRSAIAVMPRRGMCEKTWRMISAGLAPPCGRLGVSLRQAYDELTIFAFRFVSTLTI
jgi:hypothetical protein